MIGRIHLICAFVSLLIFVSADCQTPSEPPGIQDNGFLVEEAYNQEVGVVQHINTFMRQRDGSFVYTFTEEFPVRSQRHQLSYTLTAQRSIVDDGRHTGLGDLALNYRYQLIGNGETRLAVSPRITLLVPTGSAKRSLGAGGTGVQFNFPVSLVLTKKVVTHFNAGTTFHPSAQNALGDRAATHDYNLGQSVVWLVKPRFNVLIEATYNRTRNVTGDRHTVNATSVIVNPGVRWAYNFRNGLQIVPGIAVPIGVGPSRGERGVFFVSQL